MKKRLRKKLALGEFQNFLFEVRFSFDPSVDADALMDDWIEVIEANGLFCGGGGGAGEWGFGVGFEESVEPRNRENRRGAIEEWLKNDERISAYEVGPIQADLIGAFERSKRAARRQAARNARFGIPSILEI